MKAIQILECLCYMGESSEQFNIVEVPEENTKEFCKEMFGQDYFGHVDFNLEIPAGKYFYYWTTDSLSVLRNERYEFLPDGFILTHKYSSDGIPMAINFYKIDDCKKESFSL